MSRRMVKLLERPLVLVFLGSWVLLALGCGGGGDKSGPPDLWVQRFSVPNFSGILLDETVTWVFSARVDQTSLNHDSVRMRTGVDGGEAPRGTFTVGTFFIDDDTGTRMVIDPEHFASREIIEEAERSGDKAVFADDPDNPDFRYDLGATSDNNGLRQVVFNRDLNRQASFVPGVPTRPDLSDTGFSPGVTYSVIVPAWPNTNTVLSVDGDPVLAREGRVFTSTFTTVPAISPALFLGGENVGRPRVVNTDPANGATSVTEDKRISIRFSQALDPRTITTDNFFLNLVSIAGAPQTAVSLFLRQTRLGLIEVVMTPLQNLSPDQVYQVTVSPGVRDLLGSAMEGFVFSFATGAPTGQPADIIESFTSNFSEDRNKTTANWNGTKPFVGATPAALTAVYAPFAGRGADGEFRPAAGQLTSLTTGTTVVRIWEFTEVDIPIGADVIGEGSFSLVIRCQGTVKIAGQLLLQGLDGGIGQTGVTNSGTAPGGSGGSPGAGGYVGGNGAMAAIGTTGNFDGLDGFGPAGIGGGAGGYSGDQDKYPNDGTTPLPEVIREGGGGGGHATAGTDGELSASKGDFKGGLGGQNFGSPNFQFAPLVPPIVGVPTLAAGYGGAGGGGGGGEDDDPANPGAGNPGDGKPGDEDEGGGGGGGGGGAVQISAYGDISVTGAILADGGKGGNSFNASTGGFGQGAPGGGGAGGSIWLQSNGDISLDQLALITAVGGVGGQGDGNGFEVRNGGDGGDGYIRLEDSDGNITVGNDVNPVTNDTVAQFTPSLILDSTGQSLLYNQFIATPNYGTVEVDMDVPDGTIEIFVQGAREDVTIPGGGPVDPDDPTEIETRANSTDWIPIAQINDLDNYQYLRFRVEFAVDPVHDFDEPLSVVYEIRIPVSTIPD